MLNVPLYRALVEVLGKGIQILKEDHPGSYVCPPVKRTRMGMKAKRMARAKDWGQVFNTNCPKCGDDRRRLFISHYYQCHVQPDEKTKVLYHFGNVYKCQNEGCDLREWFDKLVIRPLSEEEVVGLITHRPTKFTDHLKLHGSAELPKKCIPISSPEVPDSVLQYLFDRRFSPVELYQYFHIMFAPTGTVYAGEKAKKDEFTLDPERKFYDDRLVIPVLQGRRLEGWQARRCEDLKKDKYKYLNMPNFLKSHCLYNMDMAVFYDDITLIEGVTDVWRVGPWSVCGFGKYLSSEQLELMRVLWGFNGSCVVAMDPEEPDKTHRIVEQLREEKVFPRGVAPLLLDKDGPDPAGYYHQDINDLIAEARTRCA